MKNKRPPKRIKVSLHTRFVAIVSIALPLFILGWVAILEVMQYRLKKQVSEDLTFSLIVNKDLPSIEIEALRLNLLKKKPIKDVKLISADQAAKELEKELGEDPIKVLGYNPLNPTLEINLNAAYIHRDSLPKVDSLVRSLKGVDNFSYRNDILEGFDKGVRKVSSILLAVTALMLIIAVIQINNTSHLAIYARRFLIRSMTLLGAKHSQITAPFIKYSIFNGLWGGLIAVLMCAASGTLIYYYVDASFITYITTIEAAVIAGGLIILGMLLSMITAHFSTRRYIRMDGNRMILS